MQRQSQEAGRGKLFVGTHNPGKRQEYLELLAPLEAEIRFPHDLDVRLDVRETGSTYAENARRKAEAYARVSELLTLADDSGLEVDALGGAPGIHSARYVVGSDADRVQALLSDLGDVPWEERTARFRCAIVVVTQEGEAYEAEGVCEGMIAYEPVGESGFGYDPVFYVPDYDSTMAQLSRQTKNRISHRARAVQAALPTLTRLLNERK